MSNYDRNILKQNIKVLMANNKMTQQQLADAIQMSQSNVSKALSEESKKSFTVEQVYAIAELFSVSVDWLLGYKKSHPDEKDYHQLGTFLVDLLSSGTAKSETIEVEEPVYELDFDNYGRSSGTNFEKRKIRYPAIYFPSYWDPDAIDCDYREYQALIAEAEQVGNGTKNIYFNQFLKKFIDILHVYKNHQISDEAYQIVVKDYLNQLSKI